MPNVTFQLQYISSADQIITEEATKMLAQACVNSRLDYCNSLLYGVNDSLLEKLQIVHNAAARVLTGAKKFNHIPPVLRELHWRLVCHRIVYKLATIIWLGTRYRLQQLASADLRLTIGADRRLLCVTSVC